MFGGQTAVHGNAYFSWKKSNFGTDSFKYLIYIPYLLLIIEIQINGTSGNCRHTSAGTNWGAGNENEHRIHLFVFAEHLIAAPWHKRVSTREDWAWGYKAEKTGRLEKVHDSECFSKLKIGNS